MAQPAPKHIIRDRIYEITISLHDNINNVVLFKIENTILVFADHEFALLDIPRVNRIPIPHALVKNIQDKY